LYLVGIDGSGRRQLTTQSRERGRLAWSGDGTQLAYLESQASEDAVTLYDVADGRARRLESTANITLHPGSLVWTQDDEWVVYVHRTGLSRVRVSDGSVESISEGSFRDGLVSPSGTWLTHTVDFGWEGRGVIRPTIHLVDVGRDPVSSRQLIYPYWWSNVNAFGPVGWSPDEQRLVISVQQFNFNHSEIYLLDVTGALAVAPAHIVTGQYTIESGAALEAIVPNDGQPFAFSGILEIRNSDLTDLSLLRGLRRMHGRLEISENAELTSLSGLDSLVAHDVRSSPYVNELLIRANPKLTDTAPLRRLRRAAGLSIENQPGIDELNLEQLTTVGTLKLHNNRSLQMIDAPVLGQGRVWLTDNDSLREARFPAHVLASGLVIWSNPLLHTVTGFGRVQETIYISIFDNPRLRALPDFARLRRTHEQLHIINNGTLTNLDGLAALESVGSIPFHAGERPIASTRHLEISGNGSLQDISAVLGHVRVETWEGTQFRMSISGNPLLPSDQADCLGHQLSSTHDPITVTISDNGLAGVPAVECSDVLDGNESTVDAEPEDVAPTIASLDANYPNPFNARTVIPYQVPSATLVELTVFDALGQTVRRLLDDSRAAGRHQVQWDGLDDRGRAVGSGVYLYRMRAGSFERTRRMILVK
jgi:hypothetical protein